MSAAIRGNFLERLVLATAMTEAEAIDVLSGDGTNTFDPDKKEAESLRTLNQYRKEQEASRLNRVNKLTESAVSNLHKNIMELAKNSILTESTICAALDMASAPEFAMISKTSSTPKDLAALVTGKIHESLVKPSFLSESLKNVKSAPFVQETPKADNNRFVSVPSHMI